MTTIEELKKIPVGWRFTDENYKLLDKDSIRNIKIDSPAKSTQKWQAFTKSNEIHLMKLPKTFWQNLQELSSVRVEWGEEKLSDNKTLSKIIDPLSNEMITFFWGANTSIETTWKLFIQHWDDFCYPDDDNNIILFQNKNIAITYTEEKFMIYKTSNALQTMIFNLA